MRRFAALFLSLVLLITMAATGSAASDVRVLFDDQQIQFDANPFIEDGSTLVPVRALAERLGFAVAWNEVEQQITLTQGDRTILLWVGSTRVVVNGKEGTVDVAPRQANNRTFVPVRFVAEQLGAHVAWDGNQQTAVITSGKSMLLKLNKQQELSDAKMTADLQIQVETGSTEQGTGGSMTVKLPVHMDMHLYQNNILGRVTMQLPAVLELGQSELSFEIAVKDGKLYGRESSGDWEEVGDLDLMKNAAEAQALLKESGFGDLAKLQDDFLQDAVVIVAGQEEMDGAKVVRLDVDLSKLKFSEFLDKLFKSVPMPPDAMPEFNLKVDRLLIQYWLNPDTLFTHKTTLDMAMSISITDSGETMSVNMAVNGEIRAKPVSEPIKFPDFSLSVFTPAQEKAAKLYWDAVEHTVTPETCAASTAETDQLWKAKSYTAGQDVAVKAAACFKQQGQAVTAQTPPQEFAEGHTALGRGLERSEQGYTGLAGAFELAAKGDMTAATARKEDGDKLVDSGLAEMMRADNLLFRAAMKYHLFH